MKRMIAAIASLALAVAACGDSSASTTTTTTLAVSSSVPATTLPTSPQGPIDVSFRSGGHTLAATLWPGGHTWVVLGHMLPADRRSWTDFAGSLHGAGYSVLTYDNKGFGDSEGTKEPFALYQDATAAIEYAQEQGATHVVFGGASMNGATAMKLGMFYELGAILVLSGVPGFPSVENAIDALYEVDEPILFVAAEDDGNAVADLDSFLDRAVAGDWIVLPTGGHGTAMLETNRDLADRIIQWLERALG